MVQRAQKHHNVIKTCSCKEKANYDVNVVDQNSTVLSTATVQEFVVIFDYLTYNLHFYYQYVDVCDIRYQYPIKLLSSPKGFHLHLDKFNNPTSPGPLFCKSLENLVSSRVTHGGQIYWNFRDFQGNFNKILLLTK